MNGTREGAIRPVAGCRTVRIGEWCLRPAEGLLVRDGEEIRLRPRSADVLALLADRPGEAVSKEELFAGVWQGVAVEDGALAHCISEIRKALGDSSRSPRYIETLPKRGYRLVAAVDRDVAAPPVLAPPVAGRPGPRLRRHALFAAALVAVPLLAWLGAAAFGRWRAPVPPPPVDDRPKVAVLGLSNLSGEPGSAWLATALDEMLTTELAVDPGLRTVATEAVARTKRDLSIADADLPRAETRRRIRTGLGVDYIVVGSYLASTDGEDGPLRIDLRLQDGRTGEIVAAVVESGTVSELPDLVSLAGRRLRGSLGRGGFESAGGLGPEPEPAGRLAAGPAATRIYYRGLDLLRRFEAAGALELLERAAGKAPNSPRIQLALAEARAILGFQTLATAAADRALAHSAGLPRETRLWVEARCHALAARWPEAIERLAALRLLDPGNVDYGLELARAQLASGRTRDAQATLAALREGVDTEGREPRIELLAAEAAEAAGDHAGSLAGARRTEGLAREPPAPLLRGRALLLAAKALHALGRVTEAEAVLAEAREGFAAAGDRESEAAAGTTLAAWLWNRGAFDDSATSARAALARYRQIGNRAGEADAQRRLAMTVWRGGDAVEGERMLREAVATFREIGNRGGEADALMNWAVAAASFGGSSTYGGDEPPCVLFDQALALYRAVGNLDRVGAAVSNLGRCALIAGDVPTATSALEEAAAIDRDLEIPEGLALALFNLAYARSLAGDLGGATAAFDEAAWFFRRLDNPNMLGATLVGLGGIRTLAGDLDAAETALGEAVRLRRELGDPLRTADCLSALARLRLLQGQTAEAERLAREALTLADTAPHFYGNEARMELAYVLLETGRPTSARTVLAEVPHLADAETPVNVREVAGRITLARVLGATGEADRGRSLLVDVLAFTGEKGMVRLRLEAELAQLELDRRTGPTEPVRRRLAAFAERSRRRGLVTFARRADELAAPRSAAGAGEPDPSPRFWYRV